MPRRRGKVNSARCCRSTTRPAPGCGVDDRRDGRIGHRIGSGRCVGCTDAVDARRAERHDHQAPLDREHSACAPDQSTRPRGVPRHGHRGPDPSRRRRPRVGRRHCGLYLAGRRGNRPHPRLGHPSRQGSRLPAGITMLEPGSAPELSGADSGAQCDNTRHAYTIFYRIPVAGPGF